MDKISISKKQKEKLEKLFTRKEILGYIGKHMDICSIINMLRIPFYDVAAAYFDSEISDYVIENGIDILHSYSDTELLDAVDDRSIESYYYKRIKKEDPINLFKSFFSSRTRRYMDKESLKKVICEYIDDNFIN